MCHVYGEMRSENVYDPSWSKLTCLNSLSYCKSTMSPEHCIMCTQCHVITWMCIHVHVHTHAHYWYMWGGGNTLATARPSMCVCDYMYLILSDYVCCRTVIECAVHRCISVWTVDLYTSHPLLPGSIGVCNMNTDLTFQCTFTFYEHQVSRVIHVKFEYLSFVDLPQSVCLAVPLITLMGGS